MIIASLAVSIGTGLAGFIIDKRIVLISYCFIIPLALLLPRFFYHFDSKIKKTVNLKWIRKVDFFAFFIVLFNSPASLFLHDLNFQYDRFLHFAAALFSLIIFFLLWVPVVRIRCKKIKKRDFLLFIFVVLFIALFFWETIQYGIDQTFGTKLFFDKSQDIRIDVLEDIIFGLLGLIAGMLYLVHNFDKITLSVCKQEK